MSFPSWTKTFSSVSVVSSNWPLLGKLLKYVSSKSCSNAYPNPPTSASFVQTSEFKPPEKLSLKTGQYLCWTTEWYPSHTKKAATPQPMSSPIIGKMVTHFSLGSFFDFHGWSTSPFFTLLEWKYLEGAARTLVEEPNDEAGLDCAGVPKGSVPILGAEEMPSRSPKGSATLLSGVETVDVALPLKCAVPLLSAIVYLSERQISIYRGIGT